MASTVKKPYYNVERRGTDKNEWYQVMLAPFKTLNECLNHIKQYSQYYPYEHQNYKITYEDKGVIVKSRDSEPT
jgi:hypothetical protein